MFDRHDIQRSEILEFVATHVMALNKVDVMVKWQQGGINCNVDVGRMWDIVLSAQRPSAPFGHDTSVPPTDITVRVRTGLWAEKFLNEAGKENNSALHQFRGYPRSVLTLPSSKNDLALRIGMYVTGLPERSDGFRIKTVIEAVFSKKEREKLYRNRQKQHKFKTNWDAALLDLHDKGWKIVFPEKDYPRDLQPVWSLPEGELPRLPSGYFSRLLGAIVIIKPGVEKNPDKTKQTGRKAVFATAITAGQLREARINKGLSQSELAILLGVSKTWVSLVEKGERAPSDHLTKLKKLLGMP
ncbi:MAG: helix-turn-helix transcriptional regulator [Candidatus Riflebacteria bacterium]|nr:helix-turn-helix transcriptional regulator [Candidatus Riflebacteria bacterium]